MMEHIGNPAPLTCLAMHIFGWDGRDGALRRPQFGLGRDGALRRPGLVLSRSPEALAKPTQ